MNKIILITISILLSVRPLLAGEVILNDQVRDNFGIVTVIASDSKLAQQWQATAQVLDGSTLISMIADLHAAQAASATSASEFKRTQALHQDDNGVSLKVVEAAGAQAAADRSKLQSLRAQLLSTWGPSLARSSEAMLDTLVQGLLNGSTLLIRAALIDAPTSLRIGAVRLKLPDTVLNGTFLGPLPLPSEQLVGRAYLLSVAVTDEASLQPGQILQAELQDVSHNVSGVLIPRAAIVRWQGKQWVYVQSVAGHYQRKAVQVLQWLDNGALIGAGLHAGEQVVSVGAGMLLGAENAPAKSTDAE